MITISRTDLCDADFQRLLDIVQATKSPIAIWVPGAGLARICCWCARRGGDHYGVRPPMPSDVMHPRESLTLAEFDNLVSQ